MGEALSGTHADPKVMAVLGRRMGKHLHGLPCLRRGWGPAGALGGTTAHLIVPGPDQRFLCRSGRLLIEQGPCQKNDTATDSTQDACMI